MQRRLITFVKSIFLKQAPERILFQLKKLHYPKAVRGFNEPDVSVVRRLVNQGDHVIDIGAHVGWYSKILAEQVGRTGHVYSFEPVPQTFSLLSYCVRKLGLRNVELLNYGLSDRDGAAYMEVPAYSSGGKNFYMSRITRPPQNQVSAGNIIEVRTRSLDSFCSGVERNIAFIKCDVEGHELAVVRGAATMIRKHMPAWLIEISSDPDLLTSDARVIFQLLETCGYKAYWYDGQRLRRRRKKDKSINYFFLSSEHAQKAKRSGLLVL